MKKIILGVITCLLSLGVFGQVNEFKFGFPLRANGGLNVGTDKVTLDSIVRDGTTIKFYTGVTELLPNMAGGSVTSVGMTVPTGLSITGSPITSSGTLGLTFASGYSIPSDASQSNWNTAYGWGNHATAGYAPTNNATFTGTHVIPLPYTVGTTSVTSVENYPTENYGTTGMGDVVFSIGATMTSPNITNAPVATGTVVAGTGITAAMLSRFMYFNTAAAIDITADPQIANGTSGQLITIIGSSDTNTLTLNDATGLRLTGQMVLGIGDNITLLYEGTIGDWIEISRSNN